MATRSVMQFKGFFEDLPSGDRNIAPISIQNNIPPDSAISLILANGDNIISIPALAVGALILFNPASVSTKKLKGVGGDTGLIITKNSSFVLVFDIPPAASFIINTSAADVAIYTSIIFF